MNSQPLFDLAAIQSVLPHREPFLFVDCVTALDPRVSITAERKLRAEEPQFAGHFPRRPIMPGVLIAEALAQTSGLLIGLSEKASNPSSSPRPMAFFLAATSIKFTHPAVPGDVLTLNAIADKSFGTLFRFTVKATVGTNVIASGTLTLAQV